MVKILVVEDSMEVLEFLETLLSMNGFHVLVATNAKTAKARLADDEPQLILMDVLLPDGNGRDFCRQLKANPQWSHIPVILISADATSLHNYEACGANAILEKPFDINELVDNVKALLKGTIG